MTVLGDREKLRQVIAILLDNAVKYGAAGGAITLTLRKTDRQARLIVTNSGDPIPPEQLKHLFERFYRVDKGRSRKLGGTGLGLAIVKNAVILHGGTIFAKNNPGGGLEFIFTLCKE